MTVTQDTYKPLYDFLRELDPDTIFEWDTEDASVGGGFWWIRFFGRFARVPVFNTKTHRNALDDSFTLRPRSERLRSFLQDVGYLASPGPRIAGGGTISSLSPRLA